MKLQDFYYSLPADLIAQFPAERRTESRLMVLYRESDRIEHCKFKDITKFVSEGDLFVFNNTKVIKARLKGRRKTGGRLELIIFQNYPDDDIYALLKGHVNDGEVIKVGESELKLFHIKEGLFRIELLEGTIRELIDKYGEMPLPPYIKREPEEKDLERYQTVFGEVEGAVAAPTAALHFDEELLEEIKRKGAETIYITLHVGVGTFLPVKSEDIKDHQMLPEYYEISSLAAEKINKAKKRGSKIFFCGTTTVRAIEANASLDGMVREGAGKADIFIYPGYKFKVVERMITNFHLPQATPLFLVSALLGREKLLNAYDIAIKERYRFFSYGDAMLIL